MPLESYEKLKKAGSVGKMIVLKKMVLNRFNVLISAAPRGAFAALLATTFLLSALVLEAGASKAKIGFEAREALLLEANVKQGREHVSGRVLLQSGGAAWTLVAGKAGNGRPSGLRLEARAVMLEPDVVEIETRITGSSEQSAKMIVRLGELAELNVAQMEGGTASKNRPETNLGVKVLKVRF